MRNFLQIEPPGPGSRGLDDSCEMLIQKKLQGGFVDIGDVFTDLYQIKCSSLRLYHRQEIGRVVSGLGGLRKSARLSVEKAALVNLFRCFRNSLVHGRDFRVELSDKQGLISPRLIFTDRGIDYAVRPDTVLTCWLLLPLCLEAIAQHFQI